MFSALCAGIFQYFWLMWCNKQVCRRSWRLGTGRNWRGCWIWYMTLVISYFISVLSIHHTLWGIYITASWKCVLTASSIHSFDKCSDVRLGLGLGWGCVSLTLQIYNHGLHYGSGFTKSKELVEYGALFWFQDTYPALQNLAICTLRWTKNRRKQTNLAACRLILDSVIILFDIIVTLIRVMMLLCRCNIMTLIW